jgi:thiopurine S-methyltransferase
MPIDINYWAERWKSGRIGFHEGRPNTFLERHVERLGTKRRILVPLCGKTEDMAFLAARGHEVVGIEAVEGAVHAFFEEHGLSATVVERGPRLRLFSAGNVTIVSGDLFACTTAEVGRVTSFYDRAALVALPRDTRRKYVAHLRGLLSERAPGLVVTFEYSAGQSEFQPPPFAVDDAEVRELYGSSTIALDEGVAEGPRFREAGIAAIERCFYVEA